MSSAHSLHVFEFSHQCAGCCGKFLALLLEHAGHCGPNSREGKVVVEKSDEDEGEDALEQTVTNLKHPDGIEREPNWCSCHEEHSLDKLPKDEKDQQWTESLECCSKNHGDDVLVVHECVCETNLKHKILRLY